MTTHDTRLQKLCELDVGLQNLYGSQKLAERLGELSEHYEIPEHYAFVETIGDVILGLIKKQDLPKTLAERAGVDEATANQIATDLTPTLAPVDGERGPHTEAEPTAARSAPGTPEPVSEHEHTPQGPLAGSEVAERTDAEPTAAPSAPAAPEHTASAPQGPLAGAEDAPRTDAEPTAAPVLPETQEKTEDDTDVPASPLAGSEDAPRTEAARAHAQEVQANTVSEEEKAAAAAAKREEERQKREAHEEQKEPPPPPEVGESKERLKLRPDHAPQKEEKAPEAPARPHVHTMADDMRRAKGGDESSVPRFSKPLADTPRYDDETKEEDST